jgi:hypothetical protein
MKGIGHLWTVYMATDHNILSPASVRIFTVLLCVLVRGELYSLFHHVRMTAKRAAIVGAGASSLSAPYTSSLSIDIGSAPCSARCGAIHICND